MMQRPRGARRVVAMILSLMVLVGVAHRSSSAVAYRGDVVQRARDEMRRFASTTRAVAEGYEPGSVVRGMEHWLAPARSVRTSTLDPRRPSGLMYRVAPTGQRTLVAAVFMMADARTTPPAVEGLQWHDHVICIGPAGLGQITSDGSCPAGTSAQPTPRMAHVFLAED